MDAGPEFDFLDQCIKQRVFSHSSHLNTLNKRSQISFNQHSLFWVLDPSLRSIRPVHTGMPTHGTPIGTCFEEEEKERDGGGRRKKEERRNGREGMWKRRGGGEDTYLRSD